MRTYRHNVLHVRRVQNYIINYVCVRGYARARAVLVSKGGRAGTQDMPWALSRLFVGHGAGANRQRQEGRGYEYRMVSRQFVIMHLRVAQGCTHWPAREMARLCKRADS